MTKECQYFSTTARIVLVDMKLTGLASSCLHAADLGNLADIFYL